MSEEDLQLTVALEMCKFYFIIFKKRGGERIRQMAVNEGWDDEGFS